MRDTIRMHSIQEAQVVDVRGDVGKQFGNMLSTLAILLEFPRRLEDPVFDDFFGLRQDTRVVKRVHLTIVPGKPTLVIERVDLAGTTLHEQEDHSLGTRCEMRLLFRKRVHRCAGLLVRKS